MPDSAKDLPRLSTRGPQSSTPRRDDLTALGSPAMPSVVPLAPDLLEDRPGFVRREDRQGRAPEGYRWTSGFAWELVPTDVLRAMLAAAGAEGQLELLDVRTTLETELQDFDEGVDVSELERAVYADAALATFGQKLTYPGVRRTADALLEVWLDALNDGQLQEVTAAIQSGLNAKLKAKKLRTSPQRRKFLRERSKTKNFLVNLQKGFDGAYHASWHIPSLESAGTATPAAYDLTGLGRDPAYEPYDHTIEAWNALEELRSRGTIRGLVVLPTGAGKTDVAIGWLLKRMAEEPELRVLWLAHQISLLEQSAARFAAVACQQPDGFHRKLRVFSSRHAPMSLFNPRKTDVACATIQTVSRGIGKWRGGRTRRKEVRGFLAHPTVVVIDEAHHVPGDGYQRLLQDFVNDENIHDVVGLTATPWGSTESKQNLIDASFPQRLIDRNREELIANGVLADYRVLPVRTHVSIDVTEQERAAIAREKDLTQSVLRKLETPERNAAIVEAYLHPKGEPWGRTLIFTTNTDNADALDKALREAGANVQPLHYRSGTTVASLKEWFTKHDDAVIVSVGMLLEGVDLPAARTALLGRPTTNPNVLAQMIGRVLRGLAAGGKAVANVVYFQDDWPDFGGVLTPAEPKREGEIVVDPVGPEPVPRTEPSFPADVAALVTDALVAELAALTSTGEVVETGEGGDESTGPEEVRDVYIEFEERRVVGYYVALDEIKVPVFDHQHAAVSAYLEARLSDRSVELVWAEDAPRPAVAPALLEALSKYVEVHGRTPDFEPLARSVAPITVAQLLNDGTARTRDQVLEVIAEAYDDALARAIYPTVERFHERVEHWQRVLKHGRRPEQPLPATPRRPPLPRKPRRTLDRPWGLVLERMETLLPTARRSRFVEPELRWSDEVVGSYLAQWQRITPDHHRVTINALLRSDEEHVPDELLAYLLWHEVIHLVTAGQGHDAEFYELEQRWPNTVELDADLDALADNWSCDPADYGRSRKKGQGAVPSQGSAQR